MLKLCKGRHDEEFFFKDFLFRAFVSSGKNLLGIKNKDRICSRKSSDFLQF